MFGYALLVVLLLVLGAWHGVIDRAGSGPVPERCGYRWTIPPQHVGESPAAMGAGVMKWLEQTLRGGEELHVVSVYWSSAQALRNRCKLSQHLRTQ